jgi:hypothetical protein
MDTSKYSKLFVKNLKDFTTTLDKVVETLELISNDKKNQDEKLYEVLASSGDIMKQVADSLKRIDSIEATIQSIQTNSKAMLMSVQDTGTTLITSTESMAEASRSSAEYQKQQTELISSIGSRMDAIDSNIREVKSAKEKGFTDKLSKGNANKILDGVKIIVLMAAAIIAIGGALMLIGAVNFKSVLALAIILPMLALTMSQIAQIKDLDAKKAAYIGLTLVAISMAIVATSWVLMLVADVGIIKIGNAIIVALAIYPMVWAMNMASSAIDGLSIKTVAKALIFMPLLALSIAFTSWALGAVSPISPYTLFAVIGISIATLFMAKAASYFAAINVRDMPKILLMPLLLPVIAFAIAQASKMFTGIQPVDNLWAVLSASLAVTLMIIPFEVLMKFMKGVNAKTAAVALIRVGVIAAVFPYILVNAAKVLGDASNAKSMEGITGKVLTAIFMASVAVTIIAIAAGIAIGVNKIFKLDKISEKGFYKIGLIILAMGVLVVESGAYLKKVVPISMKNILDIGLTSVAILIIALTAGLIIKIFDIFNVNIKSVESAAFSIVVLSAAILASSLILSKGDYTNAPPLMWSIGIGALFTIMSIPIAILGEIGLQATITGAAGLVIMATAITVALGILSLAEPLFKKDGFAYLFIDALLYLADGLVVIVDKLFKSSVITGLISIIKGIGEVLNMIIGTVINVLPAIINAITPIVKIIGDVLKSIMPLIKDIIVAVLPLVQGIVDFLGKIVDGVVAIVQVIGDVINKVLTSFVSAFQILMQAVATVTFSQLAGFAAGFILVTGALLPFLSEMLLFTLAIPAMVALGYSLEVLIKAAKTEFDGAEFATKLGHMGEGLRNFSDNLPGFFTGASKGAGAMMLAESVLTLSTAAAILNNTDTSTFKNNLSTLADGLVDFATKMNTLGLADMQMIRVPGLIFDGEIPAPLLAVQIAATAADIVGKVKMTAADATAFVLGMKTLAEGIGAFMNNLSAIGDGAKAALEDKIEIGTSWWTGKPIMASTLMVGLTVAATAAEIVSKVKMKGTDTDEFLSGMETLAKGIGKFINNLSEIGTKAKNALKDTTELEGTGFFRNTRVSTLLLALEIAGAAADIVSKTKLDAGGRANFEATMTMLPTSLKTFIDGLAQAKISPEQLSELTGVFEFLQKYMGPLISVLPTVSSLNGPQVQLNMTSMGMGVAGFVNSVKGLKITDAVLMGAMSVSLKQVAEVKFDVDNLNQAAVAFDKLSSSISKFADILKRYSDTIKKDNFVNNLKQVIHSLLTYSIIDVDALNKVNESMDTSVKKISEIMVKNNEPVDVQAPEKIEKTDLEKVQESKAQEEEKKKQDEIKAKAELAEKEKQDKEALQQKAVADMTANGEETNKKLDEMIDAINELVKYLKFNK